MKHPPRPRVRLPVLAVLGALAPSAAASPQELVWDARAAEHLWNRAGFGATPEEVQRAVDEGAEAFVARLLGGEAAEQPLFYARLRSRDRLRQLTRDQEPEQRREMLDDVRREDRRQGQDFLCWWMDRMVDGEDPLRERMTLFWHGHFTSSMADVRNAHEMIVQNRLLRTHALGRFGDLLREVARDPAMLAYLDNRSNRKDNPNENFARELLELFTLGEGSYSEEDVKETARAFTGWTARDGEFRFARGAHDRGRKVVLGTSGRLDGDDVIDVLLEQEACARHLAGRLLRYFEGTPPGEERLARYARQLRRSDYDVRAFLERLFLDPAFYRDEVVGNRIAGPVDFLVGSARRLGLEPPSELLLAGSGLLGQRLFFPPNVQGWQGGEAWISTSSLMQRSNLAGVLLGEVELREVFRPAAAAEDPELAEAMEANDEEQRVRRQLGDPQLLRALRGLRWRPRLRLGPMVEHDGAGSDAEVVGALAERLLARPLEPDTGEALAHRLRALRAEAGLEEGDLALATAASEDVLRRTAHLILSLPEAQLH